MSLSKTIIDRVAVSVNGTAVHVRAGTSVAAALAQQHPGITRRSVTGQLRAPLCGMGVCYECRVHVNGRECLACQTVCAEGMQISTDGGQARGGT